MTKGIRAILVLKGQLSERGADRAGAVIAFGLCVLLCGFAAAAIIAAWR